MSNAEPSSVSVRIEPRTLLQVEALPSEFRRMTDQAVLGIVRKRERRQALLSFRPMTCEEPSFLTCSMRGPIPSVPT